MALISLGSVGAAPGVTTLSVVAAGCWPRPVVLVEADPSGGVLAVRYRLGRTPGLSGLAATVRQGAPPEAIWSYAQMLPGDLPVVVSPESGPVATAILEDAAHALADWCASQDQVDVIVDCGRIAVRDVTWPLWAAADEMLLLARPRADELYPLAHRSRALGSHVRSLGTVLVGERPYRPEEVAEQLRLPVRGVIADDPRAARVLATGGSGRTLRRSPLVRSARSLVDSICLHLGIPVVSAEEERLLASRGVGEAGGRRRPLWKAIGPGRTAAPSAKQAEAASTGRQKSPPATPQPAGPSPAAAGRRLGGIPGQGQPLQGQPPPAQPAPVQPAPSQAPGWATADTGENEAAAAGQPPADQTARPAPAEPPRTAPDPGTTPGPSEDEALTGEQSVSDTFGAIPMPPAGSPPEPAEQAAEPPTPPAAEDTGEGSGPPMSPPPPPGSTMRAVVGKLTGGGFPAPPSPPGDDAPAPQLPPPPPPPAGFRRPEPQQEGDAAGSDPGGQTRSDRNGRKNQVPPPPPPPPSDPAADSAMPGSAPDVPTGDERDGLEGFIKAADALENVAASAKQDNIAAAGGSGSDHDESIDMLERTARVLADGAQPLPETGEVPVVGLPPLERRPTGQVPAITSEKTTGDLTDPKNMSNNGGRGDGDGTQRDDHRQGDEDDKITQSANPGPDRDAHLEPTPAVPAATAGGAVSGRRTACPDPGAASTSDPPEAPETGSSEDDSSRHEAPDDDGNAITTGGRWLS